MVQEEINMLFGKTNPNMINQAVGNNTPLKENIYNFLSNDNKMYKNLSKKLTRFVTNSENVLDKAQNFIRKNPNVIKNVASKVGKGIGVAGAPLAVIDAKRSFEIADAMERINKNKPGSFNQKDIDYYRNKGRWITGGTGLGTGIGGTVGFVGGAGVGSVPTALVGAGYGGGLASLGYGMLNRYNPKNMTKEDWAYLKEINNNIQNKKPKSNKPKQPKQQQQVQPQLTYGPNSSVEDLIRQQQGLYGTYNNEPEDQQIDTSVNNMANNEEQQLQQQELMNDILSRYNNISDIRQGYLDRLQNFLDNYDELNNKNIDREMYLRGLAGWTGNNTWSNMADKLNPLSIEASKLNLYKQLAEGEIQNEEELAKLVSNMRMMEQMGMDPSMAMADSKTLNNITRMAVANKQAQTRMEVAQLNAKVKELDRQARIAIAQGKREDAYKLLQMRNQANAQIAAINSIGYGGNPQAIYQAMSGFGYQVPNYTSNEDDDGSNPYE